MKVIELLGTTAAGGTATITSDFVSGLVHAVQWVDGDLADNNTAVLSVANSEHTQTILSVGAGEGDDDVWYYPRVATCKNDCTASTTVFDKPLVHGILQLAIASGGDTKTGGCYVFLEEI